MQVFTNHLNPLTGENEWNLQQENYDYIQEIARSSFADMLHDKERNDKYYEGIRKCIDLLRIQKKEVHVLDIGTGTGLLSMMALSCGVDSITACEAFTPMADCAKKILKLNGFDEKVNLIGKRSTELECGEGKEMPRKANLLITEVFDTELIGEGAIETFAHAKQHLLTDDALIVPSEATVYVQAISSDIVRRWNKLNPLVDPSTSEQLLAIPDSVGKCPGAAAVHDVQLSEFSVNNFSELSKPIAVFQFDWTGHKIPLTKTRKSVNTFESISSGDCDAVFMWWDLKMDPLGEVILSCAPVWSHEITKGKQEAKSSELPWRDHWMQAVYYLPKPVHLQVSEPVTIASHHDEYSLWFNISKGSSVAAIERPICECGLHATASRNRIGQLNDPRRVSLYVKVLRTNVNHHSVCLFLGDCCLLAIVAANLGARHVYLQQTDGVRRRILQDFIEANCVPKDRITILAAPLSGTSLNDIVGSISVVFSEPYFDTSMLPWHSLQFLYRLQEAKHLLEEHAVFLPSRMTIKGIPVQFRDLWKIRYPLDTCSGFKMQPFDEMIDKACEESDEKVEPQPLWEYPATALGHPTTLFSLPMMDSSLEKSYSCTSLMPVERSSGTLNAVALWTDWHFGDECLTFGPTEDVVLGQDIVWDIYSRQGIYPFRNHLNISTENQCLVSAQTTFNPESGLVNFHFDTQEKS